MQLLKNLINKLFYSILVLVCVCTFISSIIFMGEVDPTRLSFGQRGDEKTIAKQREKLGLDEHFTTQVYRYFVDLSPINIGKVKNFEEYTYLNLASVGDNSLILKAPYLRRSYQSGRKVWNLIKEAFPVTLLLAITSFIIALVIGLLLGGISAQYFDSKLDKFIIAVSTFGYSMPSYVVAIFFAIFFAYFLYPITGLNLQGSIYEFDELGNDILVLKNLLLPALALGIRPLSVITQITRSSLLDVMSEPYVRTAHAKGLSKSRIWLKHILRNSLVPIGTAVSGWFASLLAGAFFIETVFNFRGLGSLTVNALLNYDMPLVLGCILFTSVCFILINLLTDLFYYLVDPKNR